MNNNFKIKKQHPFHLVSPSILPFLLSFSVFGLALSAVIYMHQHTYTNINGFNLLLFFTFLTLLIMFNWFLTIIKESFLLYHNVVVKRGLKLGFALFIISEIMFFFGFFWAYFYNALSPSIFIGGVWPPFAIHAFNPLTLPLANTGVLLSSGITITAAHLYMVVNEYKYAKQTIFFTLVLSVLFVYIQFIEFYFAPFSIADGIYGATFFMITGLHGFHVIVGTIFIFICYLRYQPPVFILKNNLAGLPNGLNLILQNSGGHSNYFYTTVLSTGFITASWYWHFVDVVWIYVYIFLYVYSFY